jgi:hypothetical protein
VDVFPPRLQGAPHTFDTPCTEGRIALDFDPHSTDWLVVTANGTRHLMGRYDDDAAAWSVPQQVVSAGDSSEVLAVVGGADQAVAVWRRGAATVAMNVADVTGESPSLVPGDAVEIDGSVITDGNYGLAQIGDRTFIFGMDRAALWSAVLSGEGDAPKVNVVATSKVADRRPGAAASVEHDVVGVCYATGPGLQGGAGGSAGRGDGVSFVLVGLDGLPVSEPQVIATDLANIGGCDVAWSGKEFLVAWWDIDFDRAGSQSVIFGQRVPGPR